MDSNRVKKLGVIAIVALLALYCLGFVVLLVVLEDFLLIAIIYSAVFIVFLALLIYVGWERIKEIDEGLEDDIDNY